MNTQEKKEDRKIWNWSIGISIGILILFLFLQENESKMLSLEVKWIIVATIPLILAILKSGIIKSFKGFGIELETRLKEPITEISFDVARTALDVRGDQKLSVRYLNALPDEDKHQIERLSFIEKKRNYYSVSAVLEYFRRLKNLKFIEIVNSDGIFIGLISMKFFPNMSEYEDHYYEQEIRIFIDELENGVYEFVGDFLVTEKINTKENIIDSLPKVRDSKFGYLPVITEKGYFQGILSTQAIEKKISDFVLLSQKKRGK